MQLERTTDPDLIARIMTHPMLYPQLSDDFYPAPEHFKPLMGENVHYLVARESGVLGASDIRRGSGKPSLPEDVLGLFMTHPINALLWEAHCAPLPRSWGPKAVEMAAHFEAWVWLHTRALKLVGFIPSCNALALRYALKAGARVAGRVEQCYQRAFQIYDILIVEKSRPTERMAE